MRVKDENKEEAIRQCAIEMIVEEGFDGFSMQRLAKAANVSPATIYIYFKNKEDLLNQLYNNVHQTFQDVALHGFDPALSFEEGLWIQWKNRLKFILKYPAYFAFFEQFRNSPLINSSDIRATGFKKSMHQFLDNAIKNGEMKPMAPELFWAMAYGPFYALVRFHINERSMMNEKFRITEPKMKIVFEMVVKAFKS